MNWPEFPQSVKNALGSLTFPVGVLLGALLSVLITVLKKQLEEHASTLVSKVPSFATKVINFRLWETRYRKMIANEHRFIRLVGIRQQLELKPPRLKDVYVNLELEAPSSQTKAQHLQPALTLRSTFQIHAIIDKFQYVVF